MSQNAMRRFASAVRLRLTSLSLASLLIFSLGTGAVLADGSSSKSPATAEPVAAERLATEPLTATGRVRLPNGSPAAHAVVTAFDTVEHSTSVETDLAGRFRLRHLFGNYFGIHARTADGRFQAWLAKPASHARVLLERPLELRLALAHEQQVRVKAAGKPVGGVRVVALGTAFKVDGMTGPDGVATLWLPEGRVWTNIVAWDRQRGGASIHAFGPSRASGLIELSLLEPKSQTIRIVDQRERPIPNLVCWVDGYTAASGFSTREFDEARVSTNSRGEVTIPWLPAQTSSVGFEAAGPSWKVDEISMVSRASLGKPTVHVRRRRSVTGRIVMPPGANAEGILVQGDGTSNTGTGDLFFTRACRDGSFTFPAASDHGYAIGITDDQWSCNPWTGVVLTSDAADPADVILQAYPATPLTIRVTWGPQAEPWTGVFLYAQQDKEFSWTNSAGERTACGGSLRTHCPFDADGTGRLGVAQGDYELYFSSNPWREMRKLKIKSTEPVLVTLHRPWKEHRQIAGRLTHHGAPFRPSPSTTLRAWSIENTLATPAQAEILPDGRFVVLAETKCVGLYAWDPAQKLNAWKWIKQNDAPARLELALTPTAVYSGQVVNNDGKPVPGARVRLMPRAMSVHTITTDAVLCETVCDGQGRFKFESAPTNIIVWPIATASPQGAFSHYQIGKEFVLKVGLDRQNDRLGVSMGEDEEPSQSVARQYDSAVDHLADLVRDAHALEAHVLVGILGDQSDVVEDTWQRLVDREETPIAGGYLPLRIASGELRIQSTLFSQLKLRPPKPGEMLLVVLDGSGRRSDYFSLSIRNRPEVYELGVRFLNRNAPSRDARKVVAEARALARTTHRRVWIVGEGVRDSSSVRLAHWLEDQRPLLDRDFVIVKLLAGRDEHISDICNDLEVGEGGAWFAIIDGAGTVLANNDQPDGSFDYPRSATERRQFRGVLQKTVRTLTPKDIDRLINSLGN
jgi:hypothetical protein